MIERSRVFYFPIASALFVAMLGMAATPAVAGVALDIDLQAPATFEPGSNVELVAVIDRVDGSISPDSDLTALGIAITVPEYWTVYRDIDNDCEVAVIDTLGPETNAALSVKGEGDFDPFGCARIPRFGNDTIEIIWFPADENSGIQFNFPFEVHVTLTSPETARGVNAISARLLYRVLESGEIVATDLVETDGGDACEPGDANGDFVSEAGDVDAIFNAYIGDDFGGLLACADYCPAGSPGVTPQDAQGIFNTIVSSEPYCPGSTSALPFFTHDVIADTACPDTSINVAIGASNLPPDSRAFAFDVSYDPSKLAYSGFTASPLLLQWGLKDVQPLTSGTLRVAAIAGSEASLPSSVDGLVTLEFSCVACPGASTIQLGNAVDALDGALAAPIQVACGDVPQVQVLAEAGECDADALDVSIVASDLDGVGTFQFDLAFPVDSLLFVELATSAQTSGWTLGQTAQVDGGVVRLTITGSAGDLPLLNGDAVLCNLRFSCKQCPNVAEMTLENLGAGLAGALPSGTVVPCINNTAPVALCVAEISLALGAVETATLALDSVDNGSFDPDGGVLARTLSKTLFTCADLGTQMVQFSVSDGLKTDTCNVSVTVTQSPQSNCPKPESEILFVSSTFGNDNTVEGSARKPFKTIGPAMLHASTYASESSPVTIRLDTGVYSELVNFAPHVRLVGNNATEPSATIIEITQEAATAGGSFGVEGAEGCEMRDLTVRLSDNLNQGGITLVRARDESMVVDNCILDGNSRPTAVCMQVLNAASSATQVTRTVFQGASYGVRTVNTEAVFSRNRFESISLDAVLVSKTTPTTGTESAPVFGDTNALGRTGYNQFAAATIGGNLIKNETLTPVQAEGNDWGIYTEESITARMGGVVDFVPFLDSNALSETSTVLVSVVDGETGLPIYDAYVVLPASALPPIQYNVGGTYEVPLVIPGGTEIEAGASGYAGGTIQLIVVGTEVRVEIRLVRTAPPTEPPVIHSMDPNGDGLVALAELLRAIQFYNVGEFSCGIGTEDAYATGDTERSICEPHSGDYAPQDWQFNLSELLRMIQLFNVGGYSPCEEQADGYCPAAGKRP